MAEHSTADFDLGAWVRASTEAQGVPERLTDPDTVLDVVRAIILAKQSLLLWGQTPTNGCLTHPAIPNGDRRANSA
jgi:hypothetical protein